MHAALEDNFKVRIGLPMAENGFRVLQLVGKGLDFKPVLDYIGKIADGVVVAAPTTPLKVERHHVKRDKLFFCLYCGRGYLNRVVEHVLTCHPLEDLAKQIAATDKKSNERKNLIRVSKTPLYL